MEQFLGVPERLAELVVRYYDGNLSEEEIQELRDGLKQSVAARDWFVRQGLQSQSLIEALVPQYSGEDEPILFAQLVAMEAAAETKTVQWIDHAKKTKPIWQQWQFVIPSSIVAMLAIAAVLTVALTNNSSTTPNPSVASSPGDSGPENQLATKPIVATLTAERDAIWSADSAEGALAPG
ncbi:MAG: hypothetical protein AAF085_03790, partial [Planctomycetota bacterium]